MLIPNRNRVQDLTSLPRSSAYTPLPRGLLRLKIPVVLADDYNVAPTDLDIYPTTSWAGAVLVHPQSRPLIQDTYG